MISNSSALIFFGKLNRFDLFKRLFNKVEIAKSVYKEVVESGRELNKIDSFIIRNLIEDGFISVENLTKAGQEKSLFLRKTHLFLDEGESDTIALAIQKNQKYLLIDEKPARKVAELCGLSPIGVLGISLLAYKKDALNEKGLKEIINKLVLHDFRIGADVLSEFWNLFEMIRKRK